MSGAGNRRLLFRYLFMEGTEGKRGRKIQPAGQSDHEQ